MKVPGRSPRPSAAAAPALAPEYALMAAAHMNSMGRLFSDPSTTPPPTTPAPPAPAPDVSV